MIKVGLSGFGVTAGVVGVATGGVVAGVVVAGGGTTGGVVVAGAVVPGGVEAGVAGVVGWGEEQLASSMIAAMARKMPLNKGILFNFFMNYSSLAFI